MGTFLCSMIHRLPWSEHHYPQVRDSYVWGQKHSCISPHSHLDQTSRMSNLSEAWGWKLHFWRELTCPIGEIKERVIVHMWLAPPSFSLTHKWLNKMMCVEQIFHPVPSSWSIKEVLRNPAWALTNSRCLVNINPSPRDAGIQKPERKHKPLPFSPHSKHALSVQCVPGTVTVAPPLRELIF